MRSFIRLYSFGSGVVIVVAAIALVLLSALPANAQMIFASTDEGPGGSMNPPVTSRELSRYSDLLELGDDQRQTADALWEAFEAEFQVAARNMRDAMEELRAEFEDTQDFQVMIEGMGPIQHEMHETSERLRDELMGDLQLLLTEEQTQRWPNVERTRRRERTLGASQFSGEGVDLVRLTADMDLEVDTMEVVSPTLEQYEFELDKALIDRNEAQSAQREYLSSHQQEQVGGMRMMRMGMDDGDGEFSKLGDDARSAARRVRDINRRYARQLAAAMSEDDAAAFESEFQTQSFPDIYRSTYVSRAMEAALEFEDLDEEQRDTLRAILESYSRDVNNVNDRWASAMEEMEENSSTMAFSFGGVERSVRISGDAAADDPLDDARRARREMDKQTLDRVRSLLSEEQQARLPERRRERPQRFTTGGGDAMWVEHIEVVVDDGEGGGTADVEIHQGGGQ